MPRPTPPTSASSRRTARPFDALRALAGRTLRVCTYFTCVALVVGAIGARVAYGEAKKRAMVLGEELARLTMNDIPGDVSTLRVNGEALHVASTTTDASVDEIVDRLENACRNHADGLESAFLNLAGSMKRGVALPAIGGPGAGIVREKRDDRGLVFCFAAGKPDDAAGLSSQRDFVARLQAFAKTSDLGDVGRVRYMTVRAVPSERGALTQVVAIWTDAKFAMGSAFPTTGDAPGSDARDVVRLAGSRRTLTAAADGAPYAIRSYEAPLGVEAALRTFDAEMPKRGWAVVPQLTTKVPGARGYRRGDVEVIVSAHANGEAARVSVIEMGVMPARESARTAPEVR